MSQKLLALLLGRPGWTLLLVAGLTLPAILVLRWTRFSPSIIESFVDDRQDYLDAIALEEDFASNPDALMWVATEEGQDLFTRATLERVRKAARTIEQLELVSRVVCLPNLERPPELQSSLRRTTQKIVLNARLKQGKGVAIAPKGSPLLPPESQSIDDEQLAALGDSLWASSGLASVLISESGTAHAMLVELKDPYNIDPFDQAELVKTLEQIVKDAGLGERGYYCSGLVALQAYAYEQIGIVLYSYLPAGGLLISLAVMFVFRRFEVVVITLLIAAISICWGMALGLVVYGRFSVLMAAVPLMVLVISTADVIHLVSSYTAERTVGHSHLRSLHKTFHEVGGACVLTSITTFVGFASLVLVPSNTIRQFGFSAAAGVASALLLSVILVPIFLDWLSRHGRPLTTSAASSVLTTQLAQSCLSIATRRPATVVVFFVLLIGCCGWLASRVTLDPDLTRRFTASHPVSRSTQFFHQQFGGINSVEVLLSPDEEELLTPDSFRQVRRFCDEILTLPGVSDAQSLVQAVGPFLSYVDYRNTDGIPESALHFEATVDYLRMARPELMNGLISPDAQQLRILFRIEQTSYMQMLEMSETISAAAHHEFDETLDVRLKGSAPLIGAAIKEIILGHLQGFLICFTAIFMLITFGLRSFKLGCISILPNLTPLMLLGGLVGIQSDRVDSDILAVATLGLGLAVDDTIHFLSRFKIEHRSGVTVERALESAMNHTGLAIIRTTLILSIGFFPFAFSGYWSINMLGSYLIIVLASAVLADLVFLPALVDLCYRNDRQPASL